MRTVVLLAALVAAFGCVPATAEVTEIHPVGPTCDAKLGACTLLVRIYGVIDRATLDEFRAIVDGTKQEAIKRDFFFTLFSVDLNSPGGDVDAAMAVGRIIREQESFVAVERNSQCLSACVLVLAGGSARQLDGRIGIHRPYFDVPKGEITGEAIAARYRQMLNDVRNYLRYMNVAEGLADDMVRINPENMRVLTRADLTNYGLTEVDPVMMETLDLKQAQKYGLDRQEYMRRKKLAEAQCGGPASIPTGCYKSILKTGSYVQPDFSQYGEPVR